MKMEDKKKEVNWQKASPLFQTNDTWRMMAAMMRADDWKETNEKMALFSEQNTTALVEIFNLGFRAGIHFAQDAYEKERQK